MPADPLPMYTLPPTPDGWYQTLAPGGHEAWQVTFSDPAGETHLLLSLMTGCPYHPAYLARYRDYLRDPTTVPPPLPPEWPCAHLTVFRNGTRYAESLACYPKSALTASPFSFDVNVGPNRLMRTPDAIHVLFRGRPSVRRGDSHGEVQLDLTLYTISPPLVGRRPFADVAGHGEQLWTPLACPCTAKGQLALRTGGETETVELAGRACVDRELATRPLAEGFSAWVRGTAFLPHAVVPFRIACARNRPSDSLAALYSPDDQFHALPPTTARTSWSQGKRPHPTYFEAPPHIRLDSPRVLPSPGPLTHILYRASTPTNETGHAVCQVFHPAHMPRNAARMFHTADAVSP